MIKIIKDNKTIELLKPVNIIGLKIDESNNNKEGKKVIYCVKRGKGIYKTTWDGVSVDYVLTEYPNMDGEWIHIIDKHGYRWMINKKFIHTIRKNDKGHAIEIKYGKRKFLHIIYTNNK